MRLFIAVELPQEVKDIVMKFENVLSNFKDLRFVHPDNMHLTLSFIGEVPDADADVIRHKLRNIRFNPFTLKTRKFGFFPSANKIRVVWIGLERNEDFFKLQHDIRELFDHKEKFMPHITIARARDVIIMDAHLIYDAAEKITYDELGFQVERFALFCSEPSPEGHVHKIIEEYPNPALHV